MNCPSCGTALADGTKYCPTCGTVIEPAPARPVAPTQQMPAAAQRTAPQPAQHAVPMNPSTPPQQVSRGFDTASMAPSPKWPYVLIAVLVVAIIAILLLIFRPWTLLQGSQTVVDPVDTPVSSVTPADSTTDTLVSEADPQAEATTTATDDTAAVYEQLASAYSQLDGFNQSIVATAETFNTYCSDADASVRQSYASQAADLLAQIKAGYDAVGAMALTEASPYYATWNNMVTLYDCLYNRIRVISEAWNVSAAAADPAAEAVTSQISQILGADNDSNGVNRYKTQYNELYPQSQPQAL